MAAILFVKAQVTLSHRPEGLSCPHRVRCTCYPTCNREPPWLDWVRDELGPEVVGEFEARYPEHIAYLQGRLGGKFRAPVPWPDPSASSSTLLPLMLAGIQSQLDAIRHEQERQSAMQRAGFQAVFQVGDTVGSIRNTMQSWETLLLSVEATISDMREELHDERFEHLRRSLVEQWHDSHLQAEAQHLESDSAELVGSGAWQQLQDASKQDLLCFLLLDRERASERFTRLRILSLCIAFERDLRAALSRFGRVMPKAALEDLLTAARDTGAERLQTIADGATESAIRHIRNNAAHGGRADSRHLAAVEAALLFRSGKHGLLGLVATSQP